MVLRGIFSTVVAAAAAFALMVMLVSFPQPSPHSCCDDAQTHGVRLASPM
jgi:hypothetical protein